jgi:hypothetical protein
MNYYQKELARIPLANESEYVPTFQVRAGSETTKHMRRPAV